ncbi:MAG: response regulator transcription factor, partial [Bacteroidota bacterium]
EVLIVSMFNTKEFILKLMKIGASGYILKEKTEKELVYALMKIQDGKPHFGLEVMTVATTPTPPVEKKADLSETEVEVMCHLANGNTAAETGKLLNRSMHTVNTHRKNIFAKTGVDNIVKLTRYAIRHGYIQP